MSDYFKVWTPMAVFLAVLKLAGQVDIDWVWVALPIWLPVSVNLAILLVAVVVGAIAKVASGRGEEK